jgi:hypothetical protein
MSDRRPPEDPWSEVLEQVDDALADAGITDEPDRAALLEGVRSALDSLVGGDAREDDGPDVVVVEGGRGMDEPPTAGVAPPLRVADADEAVDPAAREVPWPEDAWEAASEASEGWADGEGPPWTKEWSEPTDGWGDTPRVVVRVPAQGASGPFPLLAGQGRFVLSPGGPAQTLFVGPAPRAYRVACAAGGVVVGVDGGMELAVQPGCSVDVEARQVTVRADGDGDTRGRYVRLDLERV